MCFYVTANTRTPVAFPWTTTANTCTPDRDAWLRIKFARQSACQAESEFWQASQKALSCTTILFKTDHFFRFRGGDPRKAEFVRLV